MGGWAYGVLGVGLGLAAKAWVEREGGARLTLALCGVSAVFCVVGAMVGSALFPEAGFLGPSPQAALGGLLGASSALWLLVTRGRAGAGVAPTEGDLLDEAGPRAAADAGDLGTFKGPSVKRPGPRLVASRKTSRPLEVAKRRAASRSGQGLALGFNKLEGEAV